MDGDLIRRFTRDGFVKVPGAFPVGVADECARLLWHEIGADPDDPSTWDRPVHWVAGMAQKPFVEAANTPVLREALDALVGRGRWVPRDSLGSFPLRFPHSEEPDDAGWHIEGSFRPPGETAWWVNLQSRDRALLMLFLFTDVDEDNAPTRIRVGSHLDVPNVLRGYGEGGAPMFHTGRQVDEASAHRPLAHATGTRGDVYLCHPFLVHAAQPHHGTRPRFMAQPSLYPAVPFDYDRPEADLSPVERTICEALRQ